MADLVRRRCGYDKVVLVPSFQPAHKVVDGGVLPEQRLAMTRLAAREVEGALVSDCEIRREGVSYSLDTVRHLTEQFSPEGRPGLIIGDDLVAGFPRWHKAELLAREADLIILHRGERDRLDFPYPHRYLNNEILPLSSSELRLKVAAGESLDGAVPEAVAAYIRQEGLYRG